MIANFTHSHLQKKKKKRSKKHKQKNYDLQIPKPFSQKIVGFFLFRNVGKNPKERNFIYLSIIKLGKFSKSLKNVLWYNQAALYSFCIQVSFVLNIQLFTLIAENKIFKI